MQGALTHTHPTGRLQTGSERRREGKTKTEERERIQRNKGTQNERERKRERTLTGKSDKRIHEFPFCLVTAASGGTISTSSVINK